MARVGWTITTSSFFGVPICGGRYTRSTLVRWRRHQAPTLERSAVADRVSAEKDAGDVHERPVTCVHGNMREPHTRVVGFPVSNRRIRNTHRPEWGSWKSRDRVRGFTPTALTLGPNWGQIQNQRRRCSSSQPQSGRNPTAQAKAQRRPGISSYRIHKAPIGAKQFARATCHAT